MSGGRRETKGRAGFWQVILVMCFLRPVKWRPKHTRGHTSVAIVTLSLKFERWATFKSCLHGTDISWIWLSYSWRYSSWWWDSYKRLVHCQVPQKIFLRRRRGGGNPSVDQLIPEIDLRELDLNTSIATRKVEAEALESLSTVNRILQDTQEKQCQERHPSDYYSLQEERFNRSPKRQERKWVICCDSYWIFQYAEKIMKSNEKKWETIAHTAHSEFMIIVHLETKMSVNKF